MPLIRYVCSNKECLETFKAFVKKASDVKDIEICKKCLSQAKRSLSAPNTSSKISIDNGMQARAVEVDPNIEELRKDWSKPPNRGD